MECLVHSVAHWRDSENKVLRATQLSGRRKALQEEGGCCGPHGQGCHR